MLPSSKECTARIEEFLGKAREARQRMRAVESEISTNSHLCKPWHINVAMRQHKNALSALAESCDRVVETYQGLMPDN